MSTTRPGGVVGWVVKHCRTCGGDQSKCVKKCAYYGKKAG